MLLEKEVFTPQEVAEYLQLTPETVYRYIRQGRLIASQLGRQYRIPKKNVELLLLATSTGADARMRAFDRERVLSWLEEDRIDEDTRLTAEELLSQRKNPAA